VIPGIRGANNHVGPPLTGWAERRYIAGRLPNEPDHLITFLVNPQYVKPGSAMPATGISPQEARDVAAYLYTLR
jgi:cytochrome c